MKKLPLLMALGVLLFSGALLSAGNDGPNDGSAEQEYDEDEYGPLAPIVWNKPVKGVVFHHKTHTMGAKLDCDACHDDLFEMEAGEAEGKKDFIMETLYEGGYCGSCHNGSKAFAANTRCTTCHIGVRGVARLRRDAKAKEKAH